MHDILVRTFSRQIRAVQWKSLIPLKRRWNHVDFFPASHSTTKLRDSITSQEPWLLPAKNMQARLSVDLPMGASSNKLVHRSGSTFQCHPKLASALRNLAKVSRISWMSDERRNAEGGNIESDFYGLFMFHLNSSLSGISCVSFFLETGCVWCEPPPPRNKLEYIKNERKIFLVFMTVSFVTWHFDRWRGFQVLVLCVLAHCLSHC